MYPRNLISEYLWLKRSSQYTCTYEYIRLLHHRLKERMRTVVCAHMGTYSYLFMYCRLRVRWRARSSATSGPLAACGSIWKRFAFITRLTRNTSRGECSPASCRSDGFCQSVECSSCCPSICTASAATGDVGRRTPTTPTGRSSRHLYSSLWFVCSLSTLRTCR